MDIPMDIRALSQTYERDGYIGGVPILSPESVAQHRASMEAAEEQIGSLHYKSKAHTILTSPLQLATDPTVLDIVESMIGPDILLYNVTYIIKEANAPSHVSWHQDLTYWGLSHDDQVSMWLALTVADDVSGCMRMLPGSHKHGRYDHETTEDESNVLLQGQTVRGIDSQARKNLAAWCLGAPFSCRLAGQRRRKYDLCDARTAARNAPALSGAQVRLRVLSAAKWRSGNMFYDSFVQRLIPS